MITVVHIITKLELGGAQENTLATCRGLDRNHFRVVLIHGPGGLLDPEAQTLDAQVIPLPALHRALSARHDPLVLLELTQILRRLRAEHRAFGPPEHFIVHTHSSKAGILGRLAARAAAVPHVIHHIHGFGFYEGQAALPRQIFLRAEQLMAPLTHAFIGVSRANLAEAQARGIIHPYHQVALIRSGMDLAEIKAAAALREPTRAGLGLSPEHQVILTIANFKEQKDPLTLIRAFADLAAKNGNVRLLYAGDGELRPQVEAALAELSLIDKVQLLGWRRDIPTLLAACDIVALSSIFEGLPRSAVQALAARRPFVGTRVDGSAELIRHGKNGYLVEPRDPVALSRALALALTQRPVDPADQTYLLAWDVAEMIRAQEKLYQRLALEWS